MDHDEVLESVNRGTREENLPSNRLFKPVGTTQKGRKLKDETHSVVGWTEISEEQDFGNSDYEAMIAGSGTTSKHLLSPYHVTKANLAAGTSGGENGPLRQSPSLALVNRVSQMSGYSVANRGSTVTNGNLLPSCVSQQTLGGKKKISILMEQEQSQVSE